ncbi:MAG TPA: flagellar hook-length control protein FliK [Nitrospirae bacterium]|nr:flagellar hook-length control protein FliK [Nitrospirota bacterium]
MIGNPGIKNIRNLPASIKPPVKSSGKAFPLKIGTLVRAKVIDVNEKGGVLLRLLSGSKSKGNLQGALIKASSEVPLTKGQTLYLEILGGKESIQMKFVDDARMTSESPMQNIPPKLLDMLASLSESRLSNTEFKFILNMLKSLPQNIKKSIPEFRTLEKLLLDIKQIDGKRLKAFVETSGVAFETRLKIAVLNDSGSILRNLMALQAEGDLKALLMRFKKLLKDEGVINTLKLSGFRISDVSGTVDRFIRDIEFFQLTSRLNDIFYTFLPVLWDDLRDGEFIFKKGKGNRRGSYSCDINLDLESMGKLSISVTILNSSFYVTFFTEREDIKDIIKSQKHILEGRFASQALPLKAISVNQKKEIVFGKTQIQGINVKI